MSELSGDPTVKRKGNDSRLKRTLNILYDLNLEIFISAIAVYAILLALDRFKDGFVSFFFNADILLIVVIITGTLWLVTAVKEAL